MAYNKDVDHQSKINEAVAKGDYASASKYEQARNEKIDGEKLSYAKTNKYVIPNGVSDDTYNRMNSVHNQSDESKSRDKAVDDAYANFNSVVGNGDIVSQGVKNTINSQFQMPSAVTEADAYLSEQLKKIQSGKTSYSDQVREMMDKIIKREKFSYDVDTDPLFQQALASAMNSGKQAMQDTIGQASALTGGYGSTYATTAGNQAYNSFIEDAYDNLPQYYQMAMEAYQMEGDELYRQYGMLSTEDDKEYNRNIMAYDATYQHRNRMYDEAYGQFRDSKSDAFAMADLQLAEHGQKVSDAYNLYNASSSYAESLYAREYQKWTDGVNQAMQMAGMQNSDWWNQTNFDEGVRQYEKNFAEQQRQYNESLAEQKRQHNEQMSYNWASLNKKGSGSGGGGGVDGYELTTSEISTVKKAFEDGGWDAVVDTLAALGKPLQNDEQSAMVESIVTGKSDDTNGYSVKSTVDKFRTVKGDNFDVKIDGTSYRVENKGKVEDTDTIKELKKIGGTNGSALLYNGDAYVKYADGYYKVGATSVFGIDTKGYQNLLKVMQK